MDIVVLLTSLKPGLFRVHASIDMGELGGFSINDILARNQSGKVCLTLPLSANHHPQVTLRGELKKQVYAAVREAVLEHEASENKLLHDETKATG